MHLATILPQPDYQTITKKFLEDVNNASKGKPASLSFLTHQLPKNPIRIPQTEQIVQAIVIGGTNYLTETRLITAQEKSQILTKQTGQLPLLRTAAILKKFLQTQYDPRATAIGLNFGFPLLPTTEPNGKMDGTVINGTKEHLLTGAIGQSMGKITREAIGKDIPIAVANDTICLTLAGDGSEDGSLIAGTGFNIGIKQKKSIINLEAGNFNQFPPTEILTIIDKESDIPGKQLFEKLISGKYLAEYFNQKAEQLSFPHQSVKTSQELSRLSQETNNEQANQLARALLERSARLVACALAAIYQFYGEKPLTFIGEGSLLWKGWKYTTNIQKQLHELQIPPNSITIKQIPNSSIQGAFGLLTAPSIRKN
jgi:hexokinase